MCAMLTVVGVAAAPVRAGLAAGDGGALPDELQVPGRAAVGANTLAACRLG